MDSRYLIKCLIALLVVVLIPLTITLAPQILERNLPNEPIEYQLIGPIKGANSHVLALEINNTGAKPEQTVTVYFPKVYPNESYKFYSATPFVTGKSGENTSVIFEKIYPKDKIRLDVEVSNRNQDPSPYSYNDIRITTSESRAQPVDPKSTLEIYKSLAYVGCGVLIFLIIILMINIAYWRAFISNDTALEYINQELGRLSRLKSKFESKTKP